MLDYESLVFSTIFGDGIYKTPDRENEKYLNDLMIGSFREGDAEFASLVLENVISGDRFFLKRMDDIRMEHRMEELVSFAPNTDIILWPCDVVDVSVLDKAKEAGMFVTREYTDKQHKANERESRFALLFPLESMKRTTNLSDLVRKWKTEDSLNWKNPEVMSTAKKILGAIDELNSKGYAFCDYHVSDFHPSRISIDETGKVLLDFSDMIFSLKKNTLRFDDVSLSDIGYPIEFAEPAVGLKVYKGVQLPDEPRLKRISSNDFAENRIDDRYGLRDSLDLQSQNYSITALLFYLMLGRMPYWGYIMSGKSDDTAFYHYSNYRGVYISSPAFIFDQADRWDNDLSNYGEDAETTELWEELPSEIRELFLSTLCWDNALRLKNVDNPTPYKWLSVLSDCGLE